MSANEKAGPYSIGSNHWPGLSKLIEECGETMQVAGKLLGSGGAVEHWDGSNLKERLEEEIADLMAACSFVNDVNDLDVDKIAERVEKKLARFREWHGQPVSLPREKMTYTREDILRATSPLVTCAPINDPYQRGICDARDAMLAVFEKENAMIIAGRISDQRYNEIARNSHKRAGIPAEMLARGAERNPDGNIDNCALAHSLVEGEANCQMCRGKCPDRARFESGELHTVTPVVERDPFTL